MLILNTFVSKILNLFGKTFLYLWVMFILFVFTWIILASFKSNQEVFGSIWALPSKIHWENYYNAWVNFNLFSSFVNSLIVVSISVFGVLIFSAPAAYVLSRIPFKGREVLTVSFILGIGIPFQAVLIPLYLLFIKLGLINTLASLIIVYIATQLPFTIFILTGFFSTIPKEVEEAAALDGAGPNRTFWTIMLPMSRSGLITAGILASVGLWNEFLFAFTYINSTDKFTLPVGLYKFYQTMQQTSDWASLFAGVVIIVIPILVFYLWLSNRIIEGMALGGK